MPGNGQLLVLDAHDLTIAVAQHHPLARRAVQQRVEGRLGAGDAVAVGVGRAEQLQPEPLRVDALGLVHERDRAGVQVGGGERDGDALLDAGLALACQVDEAVGAIGEAREQRRAVTCRSGASTSA